MAQLTKILEFQTDRCSGCNICVIQCAFHHNTSFSLAQSSLHVIRDLPHNSFTINWFRTQTHKHPACDYCNSEPQGPICVNVCPENVISILEASP